MATNAGRGLKIGLKWVCKIDSKINMIKQFVSNDKIETVLKD